MKHKAQDWFLTCEQCYRSFETSRGLDSHKNNCIQMITFTCKGCYRSFDTRRGLNQHENKCYQIISCLKCNFWFPSKRNLDKHSCNIICSTCNLAFCSKDSLELHFNSCQGPRIERLAEKCQIRVVDRFSCSKCDMDFDLRETL